MITCEKSCRLFEINHLFELESTVSINQQWPILMFICTSRYIKNNLLMGGKNSLLKGINTIPDKNEQYSIQPAGKPENLESRTELHDRYTLVPCEVKEKSHYNLGRFRTKSSLIKVKKAVHAHSEDGRNLYSDDKFVYKVTLMKKDKKKDRLQRRKFNASKQKIDKKKSKESSPTNKPQNLSNRDLKGTKYGSEKEEMPSCRDLWEVHVHDRPKRNCDDELYNLIFGEHFNNNQYPAPECLPLSLSEEILNYIDENQRFFSDEESVFVKKCFFEGKPRKSNKKMSERYEALDKASSTNPNLDNIASTNLNVAFVKGMIYRREIYGPPMGVGPPGPSQPVGAEEYVITKQYSYGKDDGKTKMQNKLASSCAGRCICNFGVCPAQTSNQLTDNTQMKVQSSKSVTRVKKRVVKSKKVKDPSQKSGNKKLTGKKGMAVKKDVPKKVVKKTISAKPDRLQSRKGRPRKTTKAVKKKGTSGKRSTSKVEKSTPGKKLGFSEHEGEVQSTSNNFCGCRCVPPWSNTCELRPPCPPCPPYPSYSPCCSYPPCYPYPQCPPNQLSRFNQHLIEEEEFKKKRELNNEDLVEKSFLSTSKKGKTSKANGKNKLKQDVSKNKSNKSKLPTSFQISDVETPSTSKLMHENKLKPYTNSLNNDIVGGKDGYCNCYSEKVGPKVIIDVERNLEPNYDILLRDDGDMKIKVEQVISGKNRVFTYNFTNESELKVNDVETNNNVKVRAAENQQAEKGKSTLLTLSNSKLSIADSPKQTKQINISVKIPKSLIKEKKIKGKSAESFISKYSAPVSNASPSEYPIGQSSAHPSAPARHYSSFLYQNAPTTHSYDSTQKREHKNKDTIKTFDEHHDSEPHKANIALLQESLHPILEKLHPKDVNWTDDRNYTAQVHTDKCVVEGNKIECLTSIPHVKVVFDLPGGHGKKIETVKPLTSMQSNIHVDVGKDRLDPKFVDLDIHKAGKHDSIISNRDIQNVRKTDKIAEDGHHKRPEKHPRYSVESAQINGKFTKKTNDFNEPELCSQYDTNKLLELDECISKMKLELRNCPCLAGKYENGMKKKDEDSNQQKESNNEYTNMDFKELYNENKNVKIQELINENTNMNIKELYNENKNVKIKELNNENANIKMMELLPSENENMNIKEVNNENTGIKMKELTNENTNMKSEKLNNENTNLKIKGLNNEKTNMKIKGLTNENANMKIKELNNENTNMKIKGLTNENANMNMKELNNENTNMKKSYNESDMNKKKGKMDSFKVATEMKTKLNINNNMFKSDKKKYGKNDEEQELNKQQESYPGSKKKNNNEYSEWTNLNDKSPKKAESTAKTKSIMKPHDRQKPTVDYTQSTKDKDNKVNNSVLYSVYKNKLSHATHKVSKGFTIIEHPKNTVTDMTKSAFDKKALVKKKGMDDDRFSFKHLNNATIDPEGKKLTFPSRQRNDNYHKGKNVLKRVISYNESHGYRPKLLKDSKEGQSLPKTEYLRKKKDLFKTTKQEVLRFSGRLHKRTEANKITDEEAANSSKSNRKLPKVGRLKQGKINEFKRRIPIAQVVKQNQEKKKPNVAKVWADHRLEKKIIAEKRNQVMKALNKKCCPDRGMMCCTTVCPPDLICKYQCPKVYSPQ